MWNPSYWAEQIGSFQEAVDPPAAGPCDAPLLCFSVNAEWLPYMLGALQQLVQPTTWNVPDQAAMDDVLARATDLIAEIGTAVPCSSAPPAVGPGGTQQACNIAYYIAQGLVHDAMQKAIDAINADQQVLQWGVAIIGSIPGAGLVINFLITALQQLYSDMVSGTLSHYQDAVTDATLFGRVACAIYGCISTDHQVTEGNFPCILTAVSAVTYVHTEVITAIHDYLSNLGAAGLQGLQGVGVLADADCSGCGGTGAIGPSSILPQRQDSGRVDVTIAAGDAIGAAVVAFGIPFNAIPVITVSCNEQDFIASVDGGSTSGFTATIKSAVSLDSPITATVFWIAVQEGWS